MAQSGGKGGDDALLGNVGDELPDGRLRQHPTEPTTFSGASPLAGIEWFDALARAHASVTGELCVGQFVLGQLGALAALAPGEALRALDAVEIDVRDFEDAAKLYVQTVRALADNVRRAVEEKQRA